MSAHEMPPPWDSDAWRSPLGLPETDQERREAWLMRAGLTMPSWCEHDSRLDPAAAVLCAALDVMADTADLVRADVNTLADRMRVHPGEAAHRIEAPLKTLRDLCIVTPLASGGWLLRRLGVCAPGDLDEAHPDELAEWARALPDAERAAVLETLARMTGRTL